MMKARSVVKVAGVFLSVGFLLGLTGCGDPGAETAEPTDDVVDAIENQRLCPVMPDEPVDRDLYVDHDGKRVYLCCSACVVAFNAEPEAFMEKLHTLHEDGETPADTDAHDHDHDHSHDHDHG